MSFDSTQFNGPFWLAMSGLIIGFLSGLTMLCLKSKCSKCNICGLIVIDRDVALEVQEETKMIEAGKNPFEKI